jgi:hypothetical protein
MVLGEYVGVIGKGWRECCKVNQLPHLEFLQFDNRILTSKCLTSFCKQYTYVLKHKEMQFGYESEVITPRLKDYL